MGLAWKPFAPRRQPHATDRRSGQATNTERATWRAGGLSAWRKQMNREKVIGAIRQTKEELGHVPTIQELKLRTGVGAYDIRRNFGVYAEALQACGLERRGSGYDLSQGQNFEN